MGPLNSNLKGVVPLQGTPYLHLKKRSALVVADLHIGIEVAMYREGIHLPSSTKERVYEVISAGKRVEAEELVLLGDVKHTVGGFSPGEREEVLWAINTFLDNFGRVMILPGNHDGGLKEELQEFDVEFLPARGVNFSGIVLLHGHAMPGGGPRGDVYIVGHDHPRVMMRDDMGFTLTRRCWLRVPLGGDFAGSTLIIMPSAEVYGGEIVNRRPFSFLNVFFKKGLMDVENAEVYLLDGTYLGLLSSIAFYEGEN